MLPFALTARKVLARPVTARLVVVAEVVVERPATRFENVELAVEMIPLLKVCKADQVLALPRFKPIVLVVDPLYPPAMLRVLSGERVARLDPRDIPLMVELARYELLIEVVADTAPLVPNKRPEREAMFNPPAKVLVAVVEAAVRLPLKYPFPLTSKAFEGEVVPMPTLPLVFTLNIDEVAKADEVVVAISKSGVVAPNVCCIDSFAHGEEVPMPTLPVLAWA